MNHENLLGWLVNSPVWDEDSLSLRVVWITLLASMDHDGIARFASVAALARRSNVDPEDADMAICCLEPAVICRVDGGWKVVCSENLHTEKARIENRDRVRKHRAKKLA